MIKLGVNLNDVEIENSYGPIPVGDYRAIVTSAEERLSRAGNDMIELTFVLDGNPEYDGKLFWHYIVFGLEHSLEALKRDMTCLGMNTNNVTSVDAKMFLGKLCRIHTKHEEYNGNMQDKIHFLKPYKSSSETVSPIDDEPLPEEPVQYVNDMDEIPF